MSNDLYEGFEFDPEDGPVYEVNAEDISAVCRGDDALLHVLARYSGKSVTVTRTDKQPYIHSFIEESCIPTHTTERW